MFKQACSVQQVAGVLRPTPVVLEGPEAEAAWLSEDVGVQEALEFLVPLGSARISVAPANPAVNKAGVEGAELLTPPDAPLTSPSDSLF